MNIEKLFKFNIHLRLIIGTLFFGFIFLGIVAHKSAYSEIDLSISHAVQSIHSPLFSISMNAVSEIGDGHNLEVVVVLATSLLFLAGLKTEAIKTALLTVFAASVGSFVKNLVNRPRPGSSQVIIYETFFDKSFPSGHVLIFTVFFGYMLHLAIFKVKTRWLRVLIAVPSAVLILFIGLSRIYLGAHWASDTIGGYMLGVLFLIFVIKMSGKSSS